jgi:NTP pyrophosphatase (non-canonical NTP hydrolase)
MWDEIASLHAHHGDVPPEIRVLKFQEERDEAAEALIGLQSWNRRKNTCRRQDDLPDELADVIVTVGVAMAGITGDTGQAEQAFRRRLESALTRAELQVPVVEQHSDRQWTASGIVLHPEADKVLLIDYIRSGYWLSRAFTRQLPCRIRECRLVAHVPCLQSGGPRL